MYPVSIVVFVQMNTPLMSSCCHKTDGRDEEGEVHRTGKDNTPGEVVDFFHATDSMDDVG